MRPRPLRARPRLETLERRDLLNATPTGALLFKFKPDAGPQPDWLQQSAHVQNLTVESVGIPNLYRLSGNAVALNALASTYRGYSGISYIEQEYKVSANLDPNDPYYTSGQLYGMNGPFGVRANQAWDYTTGSPSVVIADIDSGIDYRHQDLFRNIWINQGEIPSAIRAALTDVDTDGVITFHDLNNAVNIGPGKITDLNGNNYIDAGDLLNNSSSWENGLDDDPIPQNTSSNKVDDLIGWDWVNNDNDPFDDNRHGTHTTGTMAGMGNNGVGVAGVIWKARVMALKFLNASGSGTTLNGALAIRYAADHGARVSNNSWGGGPFSQLLFDAIAHADSRDHVVVASAGNTNNNNDSNPHYPSSYSTYSGVTLRNLIAVAATDSGGNKRASSNYGATSVDLGAPGTGVFSTVPNNGYDSISGTSMAAPHVAGAIALVLSAEPSLTDDQVIARVMSTARPLPSLAGITVTGGLLDVHAAVTANPIRVSSSTPSGQTSAPVDRVTFTFSRPVQDGSFTLADVVNFVGPNGTITATSVNRISATVYEVRFPAQSARGPYTLVIGPAILDSTGRPMDQDGDGIPGEVPGDRYTTSFAIPAPPSWAFRDGFNTDDGGRKVATDPDDNVIVVGSLYAAGDSGNNPGNGQVYITKLSRDGDLQWRFVAGGAGDDRAADVACGPDGSIYVVGSFEGQLNLGGGIVLTSAGSFDAFVVKFSPNGAVLWAHRFGNATGVWDQGSAVAVAADGSVVIGGAFGRTVDFDPGPGTANLRSAGGQDVFVVWLTGSGGFVRARGAGAGGNDVPADVAIAADGRVIVTGYQTVVAPNDADAYLWAYDATGTQLWARNIGAGSSFQMGSGVQVGAAGEIWVAGMFHGQTTFGPFTLTATWFDVFAARLSSDGQVQAVRQMGGAGDDRASAMARDAAGNLVISGRFSSTLDADPSAGYAPLSSAGGSDGFVWTLSPQLNYVAARRLGGAGYDDASGVAVTTRGIAVTGSFSGTVVIDVGDRNVTLTSAGGKDLYVAHIVAASGSSLLLGARSATGQGQAPSRGNASAFIIPDPHDHARLASCLVALTDPKRRQGAAAAREAAEGWTFEHHYQALMEVLTAARPGRRRIAG